LDFGVPEMQMADKSVALSQRDGVEGKQLLDFMFVEALHMICGDDGMIRMPEDVESLI
jgi:hypothetical protein